MTGSLEAIATEQRGYFTTSDAHDCGYDQRDIRDAVRTSAWRRLRRGAYAFAETYDPLGDAERHVVLARAAIAKLGADRVALTHQSASCAYAHEQWGHVHRQPDETRSRGGT